MAIIISGENNNDRILASDGVIDQISGINFSGIITASHINVGNNIQLGNAGIVTATTFIGNLTGNVNSSSNLLLQIGGSEKFRVGSSGQFGIAGANYGSSGQVFTSGGSGSAPSWVTPAVTGFTNGVNNRIVTATSATGLNAEQFLTWNGTTLDVTGNYSVKDPSTASYITHTFSSNFAKIDIRGTNIANSNHYLIGYGAGHANNQEFHMVNTVGEIVFRTGSGSNTDRLRIDTSGVLKVRAGIGPQLRFENQHSVTTDAVISTFDDASGTLLCLGSNFYIDGSGSESRYNTSEESTGIILNRQGYINLNTGGTGTNALNRIQITETGKVQIGLPGNAVSLPGGTEVVNIRAMAEGNLHVRAIGSLMSAPSGSGVGLDVLNNAGNAVKDLCIRGAVVAFRSATAETFRITAAGTAVFGGDTSTPIVDNGELFYRGNSTKTFQNLPQNFYLYSDDIAYNGTNPGAGMLFGGAYNSGGNYTTFSGIHGVKQNNTDGDVDGIIVFGTRQAGSGSWERARLTSEGTFSIGNTNPDTSNFRLECAGSARFGTGSFGSRIQFSRSGLGDELVIGVDGYGSNFSANDAVIQSSPSFGRPLIFGTNNQERLRIKANGNIGIKLDNPQEPLNVKGTISTGRNLAREVGTIIDVSSNYNGPRSATNVINGSKNYEDYNNNDWITANGARVNANFTLDLGAQYTCDRLVIYNQNEYSNNVREVKRFTFEGSNDKSSWTTLLDTECGASYAHEPNPGFSFRLPSNYIDDNEGVTYRYWRFTMKDFHGSTTLGGIMELELYEHAVGEATDDETTSELTSHAVMASEIYAQNIYHDLPAFFACRTSSFSIGNQTNTVIGLVDNQGPGFDTHGYWDNSNYRFNPKIPGYYQINLCCSVSYGALQAGQIYIYKNGSPYAISQLYLNSGDNYDDIALTVSTLVHLDGQSDYIDARAWRNGGNGGLGSNASDQQISGYLVRHAAYRRHGDGVA